MQFRKKPVVIDAIQLGASPDDLEAAIVFCAQEVELVHDEVKLSHAIAIKTPEGTMLATVGDWIIRGIKCEIYPCKPDIFAATYEPV